MNISDKERTYREITRRTLIDNAVAHFMAADEEGKRKFVAAINQTFGRPVMTFEPKEISR